MELSEFLSGHAEEQEVVPLVLILGDVELANLPFRRRKDDPHGLVTVQIPKARTISIRVDGILNRNESLLIVFPKTFDPDQSTGIDMASCYLLTPTWMQEH